MVVDIRPSRLCFRSGENGGLSLNPATFVSSPLRVARRRRPRERRTLAAPRRHLRARARLNLATFVSRRLGLVIAVSLSGRAAPTPARVPDLAARRRHLRARARLNLATFVSRRLGLEIAVSLSGRAAPTPARAPD